jgi:CheY-like chemotaxis protein
LSPSLGWPDFNFRSRVLAEGVQETERMTEELFLLRVLSVFGSQRDHDLFRQAAATSEVPIELAEANGAAAACRLLGGGTDLVFVDSALAGDGIAQMRAAARTAAKPAFSVLLAQTAPGAFQTDAVAAKPAQIDEAERLLHRAVRVRLPSRVLVVDDSATIRAVVRKVLTATRFPFEITEAQRGVDAIAAAREIAFDIVFLDYNLPGFSSLETMAELRREKRNLSFVLMTSAQDEEIDGRARAEGAAFLRKPFFPADIEAALCSFYGLQGLNPQRS